MGQHTRSWACGVPRPQGKLLVLTTSMLMGETGTTGSRQSLPKLHGEAGAMQPTGVRTLRVCLVNPAA